MIYNIYLTTDIYRIWYDVCESYEVLLSVFSPPRGQYKNAALMITGLRYASNMELFLKTWLIWVELIVKFIQRAPGGEIPIMGSPWSPNWTILNLITMN